LRSPFEKKAVAASIVANWWTTRRRFGSSFDDLWLAALLEGMLARGVQLAEAPLEAVAPFAAFAGAARSG
jgi:hypothetical protein